jgi:hypothetical protein
MANNLPKAIAPEFWPIPRHLDEFPVESGYRQLHRGQLRGGGVPPRKPLKHFVHPDQGSHSKRWRERAIRQGDTPIKDVLTLIREKQLPIPALIEYEYIGLRTPQEEVRKCLTFAKSALS